MGLWEENGELSAWAVFQPAWWNLDYALLPALRGSSLEMELLTWGKAQMKSYAQQSGNKFYGSVELFADTPRIEQTVETLTQLGFQRFDWSIVRLQIDLAQNLSEPQLPAGFTVRPLRGHAEVEAYVSLHRAAFDSKRMTKVWRRRILEHPTYMPDIDLVVVAPDDTAVGFCICWLWQDVGQFEPLGVHPDYQGRGLGKALELAALHHLRQHGAQTALVDHASFNETAVAVSLQTGFKQVNNALRYYIDVQADM